MIRFLFDFFGAGAAEGIVSLILRLLKFKSKGSGRLIQQVELQYNVLFGQ